MYTKHLEEFMKKVEAKYIQKLQKCLYPNEQTEKFLTRDLNEELNEILDNNLIVTKKNLDDNIREKNWWQCVKQIANFLKNDYFFRGKINDCFGEIGLIESVKLCLINYVFCIVYTKKESKWIDILRDKRCITYNSSLIKQSVFFEN